METAPPTVRFGVRKGAKFLFECEVAQKDALPVDLQHYLVRADELALLRSVEITIAKRLNIVEVDRMIACCRQHPPQALVGPAQGEESSSNRTALEDLAVYLKQRERAGVGSIGPGLLVMLIPIPDRNDYLRCQIVNTTTTVGEIGAQVSTVFEPAIDQRPTEVLLVSRPTSPAVPLQAAPSNGSAASAVGTTQLTDCTIKTEPEATVTSGAPPPEDAEATAVTRGDDALTAEDNHDPFERLRHEHAAFNAFYHRVLLEWSTKPSDIDSAQALRHHS